MKPKKSIQVSYIVDLFFWIVILGITIWQMIKYPGFHGFKICLTVCVYGAFSTIRFFILETIIDELYEQMNHYKNLLSKK